MMLRIFNHCNTEQNGQPEKECEDTSCVCHAVSHSHSNLPFEDFLREQIHNRESFLSKFISREIGMATLGELGRGHRWCAVESDITMATFRSRVLNIRLGYPTEEFVAIISLSFTHESRSDKDRGRRESWQLIIKGMGEDKPLAEDDVFTAINTATTDVWSVPRAQ